MKKTVTVALLYTLVLSAAIPAFAQRSRVINKRSPVSEGPPEVQNDDLQMVSRPEAGSDVKQVQRNRFGTVEALTQGQGVLVRWSMAIEESNAGFYIYRSGTAVDKPINSSMVPGSWASSRERKISGADYQYFDPEGTEGSVYSVRSVAIDGRIANSVPVSAKWADMEAASGVSSEQFNEAARTDRSLVANRLELAPDLLEIVESSTLAPDLTTQRQVAAQPAAKIGVRKEGMYRVLRSQLPSAIFDGTDTSKWRLFVEGNEQAINVGPNGQYIEFYGKGIDTPESDTRTYYLTVGSVAGKRIPLKALRPLAGNILSRNYPFVNEEKERTTNANFIANGDAENYWGRIVTSFPDPDPLRFTLTGIDTTAGTAAVTVKMQGYSNTAHLVTPVLNGHTLSAFSGTGLTAFSNTYTVPISYLNEGSNTLDLTTTSFNDFSMFDAVGVNYSRSYQADQGRVSFTTPGLRKVNLDGFGTSAIRVFDTSIDGSPVQISNVAIAPNGSKYTASITSGRSAVMYGVEDAGLLSPASVITNIPSTLATAANSADAVIISYSSSDMKAAATNWAAYRQSAAGGAYNVKVVDVADVYDEFGYGVATAASVKAFLQYAYNNWQSRPKYVLLMGDSTVDPRNYEGFGFNNQVPTQIVQLFYGDSGSDEALADINNDGQAEFAIGRIAARTGADATVVLNKTIIFETPAMQSFSRGALFAYDQPIGWDFGGMSHLMRDQLPASVPADFVQRMTDGSTVPALKTSLNSGKFVVNYAGHGASGLWGFTSPYLFQIADVAGLSNSTKPSIYTMLTCLNGFFVRPSSDSLAESLIKAPNGGAVASWASTTETTPDIQQVMGTRFFNQLAAGTITHLGDLVKDAKTTIGPEGDDVRFSWVLLGDPMLKVP